MQDTGRSREVGVKSRALFSQEHTGTHFNATKISWVCLATARKKKKRNCGEARWFYIGEGTAELCKNGGKISCILFLPSWGRLCSPNCIFLNTQNTTQIFLKFRSVHVYQISMSAFQALFYYHPSILKPKNPKTFFHLFQWIRPIFF